MENQELNNMFIVYSAVIVILLSIIDFSNPTKNQLVSLFGSCIVTLISIFLPMFKGDKK